MLSEADLDNIADILDVTIETRWDGLLCINMEDVISNLRHEGYDIVKRSDDNAES